MLTLSNIDFLSSVINIGLDPFLAFLVPIVALRGQFWVLPGPEVDTLGFDNLGFGPYKCTMAIFANFGHFCHCCPNLSWHLKINVVDNNWSNNFTLCKF